MWREANVLVEGAASNIKSLTHLTKLANRRQLLIKALKMYDNGWNGHLYG